MKNLIKPSLWTPGSGYDTIIKGPAVHRPMPGHELVDLKSLGILPWVAGGAPRHGTHTADDVVTQTADGRDLNQIWSDFMDLIEAVNATRTPLINFLTYPTDRPVEAVAQPGDGVDFEEASEFGEPVGSRIVPSYFNMAFSFKWYDLAARYTWQYLADATASMVDSVANAAVEAYGRKLLFEILRTIFNSTNGAATIQGNPYTVYKFYNNDGTVPPTYKTNTFLSTHNHYLTTGEATLEGNDLDVLILDDLASHGYSMENGYRLVIMVHRTQGDVIRTFRAGQGTPAARYDFIPAQGQPGQIMLLNQTIFGANQPSNTLNGLNVIGSYGPALIVQDDWMPQTHVFGFATGGEQSINNPVGLREHAQTNLRGLRLVKGRVADYPLIDSYWVVGFGTGIRQRGAGVVLEVTADATYDPPAVYA